MFGLPMRFPLIATALLVGLGLYPAPVQAASEPTNQPLFSRHVVPLFSRLGCNAGLCHGAVKGQNGFQLTLFGADPALDHLRLMRDSGGRRVSLVDPDSSLMLLKATGRVAHQGGKRMEVGSPEYQLLRNWIEQGAVLDKLETSATAKLAVSPASQTSKRGESYSLRVQASFADGSSEDVTSLCTFESRDRTVAEVDATGQVRTLGVGDTVLIVRYRSQPVMAMVLVPGEATGAFPEVKEHNYIDKHVLDKLKRLNIQPSQLCDDVTFLRRVYLDVTGTLPTPEEIRGFLADTAADKRTKKIEELLERPGYSALWATKFCDILRPGGYPANAGLSEAANTRRFYEWVRARLKENTPYDQFIERVLTATSREGRPEAEWVTEVQTMAAEDAAKTPDLEAYAQRKTLDLYWQRTNAAGVKGTLQLTHSLLGLRLECAQCHRHPHDIWQQDDLLSFANFFMRVSSVGGNTASPEVSKEADGLVKEAKQLREDAKKVSEQAKDKSLPKEEMTKLQMEAKTLNDKAKTLDDVAKRLKGTEIHFMGKPAFASVTSTLGSQKSEKFRLLGSSETVTVPNDKDPREVVMGWLRRPDNSFFARAMVNRVWAHYFGRGIVDPPDHLSPLNPPSHPQLLSELSDDFVKSGYDLKRLHRTILASRTYQQSAQTNASNRADSVNYASFYLRRLPAEVLVDAINHATASGETYPPELYLRSGARAMEVAGGTGSERAQASLQYAFHIFGRPSRSPDVQCDCERDTTATVVQTLYLANHPRLLAKISAPEGRVAQLIKNIADDEKRIDEVFLWTLSRLPTDGERKSCLGYIKESPSAQKGLEDVMWSLLNTREFLLNH
jgi:hypothetical protein